jgi:hypothetical protein
VPQCHSATGQARTPRHGRVAELLCARCFKCGGLRCPPESEPAPTCCVSRRPLIPHTLSALPPPLPCPCPAAEKILGKEPEVKADFSRSQQAMSKARQKGVARFLPNPGALSASWQAG